MKEYNVLVSTRVGEEGLDISEVNLVVLYDNVPSSNGLYNVEDEWEERIFWAPGCFNCNGKTI